MKVLLSKPVLSLGALLWAGAIGAQVTFLDGGYAELCSNAAHNVGKKVVSPIEITGSRVDLSPLEVCSRAIDTADTRFNRAGSYVNRGVLYYAEGDRERALADFERASTIHESLGQAHINRGYVLVELQRWEQALAALDRGIELGIEEAALGRDNHPGSEEAARAYFSRAIVNEELGRLREAYADYTRASELAPEWEDPRRELGRFRVGAD